MKIFSVLFVYVAILTHLLFSFYIYSVGVAPFALISVLIFSLFGFFWINKKNIRFRHVKNSAVILIFYSFFSLIWSLAGHFFWNFDFKINSFFGFILNIFMLLGWVKLFSEKEGIVIAGKALNLFFLISLLLIIIQILGWYLWGAEIDYMVYVTGEEQRLIGHQMNVGGINTRRASGIFAEPAVYCWVMIGFAYFLFDEMGSEIKRNLILFIFLLTVIFTFSLSGIVLSVIIILFKVFNINSVSNKIFVAFIACCVLFLSYPFIDAYLNIRLADIQDDGSFNDKRQSAAIVFNYIFNPILLMFGIGLGSKVDTPALNFLLSALLHTGLTGTILIISFVLIVLKKIPGLLVDKFFIFLFIVVLGNHVTMSLTWFVFGAMCLLMVGNKLNASSDAIGAWK